MPIARGLIALVFVLDAADAAVWLAEVVPRLSGLPLLTVGVVVLRALVGSVEVVSIGLLWGNRPSATAMASTGLIGAALVTTLIVGLGLAPSDIPPAARTPAVIVYWVVAIIGLAAVSADRWRRPDARGRNRRARR